MPEPVFAPFDGIARIERLPPPGMIALRGDPQAPGFADAVAGASGMALPAVRRVATGDGGQQLVWMAPDEFLWLLPPGQVAPSLATLDSALAGQFALAVDVSDARACFAIAGAGARDVLARLCPVDLAPHAFGPGEIRRTRAAQAAAAFWMTGADAFTLVCFRSVAVYMWDLLCNAAAPEGQSGLLAQAAPAPAARGGA